MNRDAVCVGVCENTNVIQRGNTVLIPLITHGICVVSHSYHSYHRLQAQQKT